MNEPLRIQVEPFCLITQLYKENPIYNFRRNLLNSKAIEILVITSSLATPPNWRFCNRTSDIVTTSNCLHNLKNLNLHPQLPVLFFLQLYSWQRFDWFIKCIQIHAFSNCAGSRGSLTICFNIAFKSRSLEALMATVYIQRRKCRSFYSYAIRYKDPVTSQTKHYKTFRRHREAV